MLIFIYIYIYIYIKIVLCFVNCFVVHTCATAYVPTGCLEWLHRRMRWRSAHTFIAHKYAKITSPIRKTTYSNRKFDIIILNKLRLIQCMAFYLGERAFNIIYWICHFICHTLNINLQIPNTFFPPNQGSSLGCCFWERSLSFELDVFSLFSAEPLYQNVYIDHRITFTFW